MGTFDLHSIQYYQHLIVMQFRTVPTNKDVFLCGLRLCGESRSQQWLLDFKKKIIGGNHASFRDN